jgi:hypothetical protein
MKKVFMTAALATVLAGAASGQVSFREVGRVDLTNFYSQTATTGSNIAAVAWNGTDLYTAGYSNAGGQTSLLRINTPLSTGTTSTAQFGQLATVATRGYTGLHITGNSLIATWDNGGGASQNGGKALQNFGLGAGNPLNWDAGTFLGTSQRGFAGASFNPGPGGAGGSGSGVSFALQGSGAERLLNEATGAAAGNGGFFGGTLTSTANATTYRDIDFDSQGNAYVRNNNSVTKSTRTGAFQYNGGAQSPFIVSLGAGNNVVTNIQVLNITGFGEALIFNNRSSTLTGQGFLGVQRVSNLNGTLLTPSFFAPDGSSPFVALNGAAAYDYSFDEASQTLAVSDFSNNTVYIFSVVPAPGTAGLLALGGLLAARRRR